MYQQHDPDSLKAVSFLPLPFQPIFSFRYFNSVQSDCFPVAFLSDDNMVISAPTGSGKTGVFELCILRLLTAFLGPEGQFNRNPGTLKTVYIAPTKALVQEKVREWKRKFGQTLGLNCQELTGDTDISDARLMQETDVILTTPEKFDSITRRHRDHGGMSFFADIALIEIDEVHLLSEPRGAALEAVVSRVRMLSHYPEMRGFPLASVRIVAVSATIPNIEDIAEWLGVPKSGLKWYGEEMRPVRLTTRVYGYAPAKNDFLFERRLQNFLFDVIVEHSNGKAVLVFCSTRKGAQEAAVFLAQTVSNQSFGNRFIKSQDQYERLQLAARDSKDKHLQGCIRCGVGYHNGGLDLGDRNLVEGLFLKGDLKVLCTTNTLAHGVNLPAHTVIIKSTQYYNKEKGCYTEYDRSTLIQMCGRAGRPPYDETGIVIVMTRKETVHLYENLLSGSEMVESEMLRSIAEHLNAEIVLSTVSDVSLAIDWLKNSFLYVRIKKNPQHYGIQRGLSAEQLENKLKDICLQHVNELVQFGVIQTDQYGYLLKPLEPGRLMTKYYLNFLTMKEITNISEKGTLEDLIHVLTKSQELSWIKLRRNEKKLLNDINLDMSGRIKFHITGTNGKPKRRIQTYEEKIFVLTNDALSGEPSVLDFTLNQDVNGICSNGMRIARCMHDYFKYAKRYQETKNALILAKCLLKRLWEDNPYQLKQLGGVGMVTAKAFLQAGIDSFEKLASADPRRLESITGRKYPFGNQVKESLDKLPPKVEMKLFETECHVSGKQEFILSLTRISVSSVSTKWHNANLIVGIEQTNRILYHERIRLEHFSSPYRVTMYHEKCTYEIPFDVTAALISEDYVGLDVYCTLHTSSKPDLLPPQVDTDSASKLDTKPVNGLEGKGDYEEVISHTRLYNSQKQSSSVEEKETSMELELSCFPDGLHNFLSLAANKFEEELPKFPTDDRVSNVDEPFTKANCKTDEPTLSLNLGLPTVPRRLTDLPPLEQSLSPQLGTLAVTTSKPLHHLEHGITIVVGVPASEVLSEAYQKSETESYEAQSKLFTWQRSMPFSVEQFGPFSRKRKQQLEDKPLTLEKDAMNLLVQPVVTAFKEDEHNVSRCSKQAKCCMQIFLHSKKVSYAKVGVFALHCTQ
ncbi:hypothetical protein O6H91_04G117200 [Diphasiastrum complanatum]|uniref:Uncharacterized protein n=1 Tax=Diphasiastrum complanatum TaxID=34168 RepID=A0ACC2E129_DIPCM|nr:hypothetical protein O6H91_04G117200 [Diphasiastrum complanatum]